MLVSSDHDLVDGDSSLVVLSHGIINSVKVNGFMWLICPLLWARLIKSSRAVPKKKLHL
jgi:hypothetical protein